MANFNSNIESIITGLSDFWLQYFNEIDILRPMYKGMEFEVGQTYLDMLSLLLNNSVQDTTVFNKEFFKLLTIKESDIRFRKGLNASQDFFTFKLPDNVRRLELLNNKLLEADKSLNRRVDFFIDDNTESLDFVFDPTNAYKEAVIGSSNSAVRFRSRIEGSDLDIIITNSGSATDIEVLNSSKTTVSLRVNESVHTANDVVAVVNTHRETREKILASAVHTGEGPAPHTGGTPVALKRVESNPLEKFATRITSQVFGGRLFDNGIDSWIDQGVQKGDILRILKGPGIGTPKDFTISLIRDNELYIPFETPLLEGGDKTNYVILRDADHFVSEGEPINISGAVIDSGSGGTITPVTRRLTVSSAVFSPVHVGDVIELNGIENIGYFRIIDVEDSSNVILGTTGLISESSVDWKLHSVLDASNVNTDGSLVDNNDGTANFTAASATFSSTDVGAVLRIADSSGPLKFSITELVSATEVVVDLGDSLVPSGTLEWGLANNIASPTTVVFSAPVAWPRKGTFSVTARRELDGQGVVEGTDYTVNSNTGIITPKTVWRTELYNTTTYRYRRVVFENVTPVDSNTDGTITSGTPNTFSSPSASFTDSHVGYAIKIANSGLTGATNNGIHFIAKVTSSTSVELTDDKAVPTTVDPNNGSLEWELLRRGTLSTEELEQELSELSLWAPNALLDKFNLYNTYGYLINKFDRSSEQYRSLIRGLFQLFMLGPTLEKFESAINTVSGLPVIRNDGEVLLGYDSGAIDSGSDGVLDFSNRSFSSVSAVFTTDNIGQHIFIASGANENSIFTIIDVSDTNTVILDTPPITDSAADWELSQVAEQAVTTSERTYTFDRKIPIRERFKDSSNFGILTLRSLEAIADVFSVTDYVESPQWHDLSQVPLALWPNTSLSRRQSSPSLFENTINPPDSALIGDPGFLIGADSEGFVPQEQAVRDDAGALDGTLTGDPLYPFRNTEIFFESPTANFTATDVGSTVVVNPSTASEAKYRISELLSSSKVRLVSDVDVEDASGLDWEIVVKPLAKRHKAAFVILNDFLKHHLISVTFDAQLLELLPSNVLTDLQELVFVAKPSYTYIVLTPGTLFDEIITVSENSIEIDSTTQLSGSGGDLILSGEEELQVIGESWKIGSWYRNIENSSSFSAPVVQLIEALGSPPAGFQRSLIKWVPDFAAFTSGGDPIQPGDRVFTDIQSFTGSLEVSVSSGEVTLTAPAGSFNLSDIFTFIEVTSGAAGNQGLFRIGKVVDDQTITFFNSSASNESGLDGTHKSAGTSTGRFYTSNFGQAFFEDLTGRHTFTASHVGTFIYKPYKTTLNKGETFEIREVVDTSTVRVANRKRVSPMLESGSSNITATKTGVVVTVDFPGGFIFSKDMAEKDRDPELRNKRMYFVQRMGGSTSTGVVESYKILKYISSDSVEVDTSGGLFFFATVAVEEHPTLSEETPGWEHVKEQFTINRLAADTVDFDTPSQDTSTVNFTAYGIQEPVDPTTESIDESLGDVPYFIGMPDPKRARFRKRTALDVDLREDPVKIIVTTP